MSFARTPGRVLAAIVLWGVAVAQAQAQTVGESGWMQVPQGPGMNAAYLGQMAVALILVVFAILALAFVLRRTGGIQARLGYEMRILGGLSVGGRERVALIQVGETQILLGIAPGRVQTLHVLTPEQRLQGKDAAVRTSVEGAFARSLRQMLQKGSNG
jgi:flagellar protein FliO/FliZ